jgi:hypothetical protein
VGPVSPCVASKGIRQKITNSTLFPVLNISQYNRFVPLVDEVELVTVASYTWYTISAWFT